MIVSEDLSITEMEPSDIAPVAMVVPLLKSQQRRYGKL